MEENQATIPQAPAEPNQVSSKKTVSPNKLLIVGGTILIVILLGIANYVTMKIKSVVPSQKVIYQPQPVISVQEKVENQEEFLLLLGGEMTHDNEAYQIDPTLNAQILDSQNRLFFEKLSNIPPQDTIYRIDLVRVDGKRKSINTTLSYCPPHTDVCNTLTNSEPPPNSQSYWSPIPVIIEAELEKIEYSVAGKVVKTIVKPSSPLKIISLDNSIMEDATKITWKIDKNNIEYIGLNLEYLSSPNNWEAAGFGDIDEFTSFVANQNSIYSTFETLDFRLIATDGFRTDVYLSKNFIPTPVVKNLDIHLSGAPTSDRISGQDMFLKLSFIDPQTGVGCNGEGCKNGANQGKYEVTWASDKQNICKSDIYNGELQYRFKKIGTHTIEVKVQHKDKEYPNGEAALQITVQPSPFPVEDNTNPNCSF